MRFLDDFLLSSALLTLVVVVVVRVHAPVPHESAEGFSVKPDAASKVPLVAAYEPRKPIPVIGTPVLAVGSGETVAGLASAETSLAPATQPTTDGRSWVRVSGTRVNLRAGPGAGAQWLAAIDGGTLLERLGEDGDWVEVRDPGSGVTGWMAGRYLERAEATDGVTAGPPRSAPGT